MRRALPTLVVLAAVVLAGCSEAEPKPAPAPAPSPAETTGGPTGAPTAYDQYVALGDSYTAAPLVPPTDASTICLRSGVNYPALVTAAMAGTELTDVSCSGATTGDITAPQQGRTGTVPPQLDAVRRSTDLVTIGLGGNDEGLFGTVLAQCTRLGSGNPVGSPCTERFADGLDATLARIHDNLVDVVDEVRDRAPHARVLLVGYPQIVPEGGSCDDLPLADGDYAFARQVNEGLTDTVEAAAGDARAEYVDIWSASAEHDICADEPWINGRVTSASRALAYHPLAVEQQAVAELVVDLLRTKG